jgi:hypothetical protein
VTREQWLGAGVAALRPTFNDVGYSLPEVVHASIGFPSRGGVARRVRVLGQCWSRETSKDGNCQIFISPVLVTPVEVLDTLAHELVHVVTPGAKHRGKFITVSRAVGLTEGKPTSAAAGAELRIVLEEIAHSLGSLPHPAISPTSLIAKQSTRMVKCECPDCGYTARTSRKWLEIGAPICPACRIDTEVIESIARLNGDSLGRGLVS